MLCRRYDGCRLIETLHLPDKTKKKHERKKKKKRRREGEGGDEQEEGLPITLLSGNSPGEEHPNQQQPQQQLKVAGIPVFFRFYRNF